METKFDDGKFTVTVPNHNLQRDIIRWDRECWDATILLLALESFDYEQFTKSFNSATQTELSRSGGPSKTQFVDKKKRLMRWIHSLGHARCETISELKLWEKEIEHLKEIIKQGEFKK